MHLTECYETAHHLELEDAARVGFPPVASLEIGLAPLGREGPGELRCRRRVLTEAPHQGREVVADAFRRGHARASGEVFVLVFGVLSPRLGRVATRPASPART